MNAAKTPEIHTAMLLAAGMGTRLRPLTEEVPKSLINVGGEPMILRVMDAVRRAGIQRVVINTHYLGHMIESTVKANTMGLQVHFSREDELLETGGGIKRALKFLGEHPFLVINSDAVWDEQEQPMLRPLMKAFNSKKHDVLMSVVPTTSTKAFRPEGGDFVLDKKTRCLSRPKARNKADMVYAGVHVTHPGFIAFEAADRFSLVKPWAEAEAQKRLHGLLYPGQWVDMGTHTGLLHARELMRKKDL